MILVQQHELQFFSETTGSYWFIAKSPEDVSEFVRGRWHNSQEEREQVHVTKAVHMSENENRKEMTF